MTNMEASRMKGRPEVMANLVVVPFVNYCTIIINAH